MLDLFSEIKSSILKRRTVFIDNAVFRLHWLVTSILLIVFSVLLTARQYVGQPIDCLIETNIIPTSMINTYCWISQTFLMSSAFNQQIGIDIPHPGVKNSHSSPGHVESQLSVPPPNGRKYYPYYQWICFVLFLQAISFYMPHYIWKLWEGGLMSSLSMDLQVAVIGEEERISKRKILSDYLFSHLKMFDSYAYKYFFCEFLSLFNLVCQFLLTDIFLDGHFMWYGINVLNQTSLVRNVFPGMADPQDQSSSAPINYFNFIFPRMTKCIFHYFGSSGDVQRKDALCLLPLNVFHEKIYLFIWFWFAVLFCLSAFVVLLRIFMIVGTKFRSHILKTRCKFSSMKHLNVICRKGSLGDFFLFYLLSKNMDPIIMQEIVYDVGKQLIRQDNYYGFNPTSEHLGNKANPNNSKHHPLSHSFRRTGSLDQINYKPINKKYLHL